MTTLAQVALLLTLLAEPLLALVAEVGSRLRERRGAAAPGAARRGTRPTAAADDLTVLVPVTRAADLDGLAWLHGEGERVLLVTSGGYPRDLQRRVWETARAHGFRVHVAGARRRPVAHAPGATTHGGAASADRTRLLADAHAVVRSSHVVHVDPGTVVACPLEHVVGALTAAGLDVATLPPTTTGGGLVARLQRVEDALLARLRGRVPWLVRGGAHVARRTVHADLLRRHTGHGAGDALELGVLAVARRYRLGRLDLPVHAPVPPRLRAWLGAHVTHAAGLFRLAVVHPHLAVRHPSLHLLAAAAAFALVPLLWWAVVHVPWALVPVVVVDALVALALARDPVALLHPAVTLLRAFVLLPLGAVAWAVTAVRTGSAGILREHDPWWEPGDAAVLPRLPGPARATDFWASR